MGPGAVFGLCDKAERNSSKVGGVVGSRSSARRRRKVSKRESEGSFVG